MCMASMADYDAETVRKMCELEVMLTASDDRRSARALRAGVYHKHLSSLANRSSPTSPMSGASELNPLSHAEIAAMVEKQVTNHPPLQVCYPGHRPIMVQADGDRARMFYVECAVCRVRTARYSLMENASHAWAIRDVAAIIPRNLVAA